MGSRGNPAAPYFVELRGFERNMLRDGLMFNNWNISETARMFGVSHHFIRTRRRELDVRRDGEAELTKDDDEKRDDEHPSPGNESSDSDQSADETDGETDSDDGTQDGDGDRSGQP